MLCKLQATSRKPRTAEKRFVAEGYGVDRRDVVHDDFVIVGPAADPAGVRDLRDAPEALRRIAAARAPFVWRGDDSGTDKAELRLWRPPGTLLSRELSAGPWRPAVAWGDAQHRRGDGGLYADRPRHLAELQEPRRLRPARRRRFSAIRPGETPPREGRGRLGLHLLAHLPRGPRRRRAPIVVHAHHGATRS